MRRGEQWTGAVPTAFCPPITYDLSISRSCVVAWESAHTHTHARTQARTHTLGVGGGRDGGGGRIKKLKRASRRMQNKPVETHSFALSLSLTLALSHSLSRLSFRFARPTGVCNCSTRETFKHNKLQLKLLPHRRPQHTTAWFGFVFASAACAAVAGCACCLACLLGLTALVLTHKHRTRCVC